MGCSPPGHGQAPVDLCLDIQPVGLIQVVPPRQTGADLQHGEVVGEGLHLEPSGGNAGRSQGLRQRQLAVQIGSQEHQVRLGSEKRLQLRGLIGAHVGHILPQLQPPLIVGVLGHRCQRVLPSCQDPGLRVAADQGCHPLGRFLQGNGTAQAVREAHRAPHLPRPPTRGTPPFRQERRQAQRDSRQSAVTRDMDRFIIIWDFLSFQKPGSGAPDRMTGPILPQDLPGCHKNLFFPRPERTFLPHAPGMRVRLPQCCAPAAAWSRGGRCLSLFDQDTNLTGRELIPAPGAGPSAGPSSPWPLRPGAGRGRGRSRSPPPAGSSRISWR